MKGRLVREADFPRGFTPSTLMEKTCTRQSGHVQVGNEKDGMQTPEVTLKRAEMVMDLQSYTFDRQQPSDRDRFIAVQGNTQYILTQKSMIVKHKNRVVSAEPTLYYNRLR